MMEDRLCVSGLSEAQLRTVVESAVGRRVSAISTSFHHRITGHPGYRGEKCIPTFRCTASDGTRSEVTMFVKRLSHPEGGETRQIAFLAGVGAPIPKLYGVLKDKDGHDILFLEYLPIVYRDEDVYSNPDRLRRFLRLAAQLNTLPLPRTDDVLPSHADLFKIPEAQISVLTDVAEHATGGNLGDELKRFFTGGAPVLPHLQQLLARLSTRVKSFPLGFVHGDFWPFHTGSRDDSQEILAIDLGCACLAPRFFDIAPFIGPPDTEANPCMRSEDVARAYLAEYNPKSGGSTQLKEILLEADAVWTAWNARRVPWLLESALKGEEEARVRMHWYLSILATWREDRRLQSPYKLRARLAQAAVRPVDGASAVTPNRLRPEP